VSYQVSQPLELAGGCTRASSDPSRWTICQVGAIYSFSKRTSLFAHVARETSAGDFARPQLFLEGGFGAVGGSTTLIGAGIRHVF
jgi:predicted porin